VTALCDYFTGCDDVLKNRLGISEPGEMKRLEEENVPLLMTALLSKPPKSKMDFSYLKRIHRKLFGDLYIMAGKVRTVDLRKGNSVFCHWPLIDSAQEPIFTEATSLAASQGVSRDELARKLAWISSELNALHPFRDGNGRAIRTYLIILAMRCGYHLDYSAVDDEQRIKADIAAFSGDLTLLNRIYT
jgi:cell filamentation protein